MDHSIPQLDAHAAKGWLLTSLAAAAIAVVVLAVMLLSPWWQLQALVLGGFAVFILVLLHNPLRWYRRIVVLALGTAAGTALLPSLNVIIVAGPTKFAQMVIDHSKVYTAGLLVVACVFGVLEHLYTRMPPAGTSPSGPTTINHGPVTNNQAPITVTTLQGPVNTGSVQNQTNNFGPTTNVGRDLINNYGISEATLNKIIDAVHKPRPTDPLLKDKGNFADAGIRWNRFFTGREADLARLHTALAGASQAISHVVFGAGGVGKTELARAFAFTFSDEYDGLWWIDASDAGFSNSVMRAFKAATGTSAAPDAKPEEIARELRTRWSTGRHLVILDNLDSAARLELFPPGGDFRVLATTRVELSGAATVQSFKVDVLSEDAAVELLTKQTEGCTPPHPQADLRVIAIAVDCHTLAVALAGAYLAKYKDVAAADYPAMLLEKAGQGGAVPTEWGEGDPLLLKYFHSIRSCLSLHFDKFAGKPEMVLLGLASFCAPTGIPLDVLAKSAKVDLPTARTLAGNLAALSIIDYQTTLSLHRLTQMVVRSLLNAQTRDHMIDAVVETLKPEFANAEDHTKWPRRTVLAAHAGAVIGHAAADHASQSAAQLANELGLFLKQVGRYTEAQRTYETCVLLTSSTFGPDHPNMATLLSNLASIQQDQGDLTGALATVKKAIAIKLTHYSPDHLKLAMSYNNMQSILWSMGNLTEAREYIEKAIAIELKHFPAEHPNFATRYSNLAMILQDQGDLRGAREIMKKAIEIGSKHLGLEHPQLANYYSNLAGIQKDSGDLSGARASVEKAIAIMLKHLSSDHPHLAVAYNNLAHIVLAQGHTPEAVALWRKSYPIRLKALGPDHAATKSDAAALRKYDPPWQ